MQETARDFIFASFSEVVMEEEFLETPREVLIDFLQSEYLRIDSEFQVCIMFKNFKLFKA